MQAKPGEEFKGQLAAIAPEVDERNRHFRVEVRVDNRDSALLAGMYATARLVVASAANAIVVPREAVMSRDGKRVVLKVDGEKVAASPVTEGLNDGRQVQIVSGLTAGDQVVADARRQLPADARVKAVIQSDCAVCRRSRSAIDTRSQFADATDAVRSPDSQRQASDHVDL